MRSDDYRRRYDDVKIDMVPRWLNVFFIILKGSLVLLPFIIASIAMFWESNMSIMESGLWNCIWLISLLQIINYADKD